MEQCSKMLNSVILLPSKYFHFRYKTNFFSPARYLQLTVLIQVLFSLAYVLFSVLVILSEMLGFFEMDDRHSKGNRLLFE